jgi:hypothetical protein
MREPKVGWNCPPKKPTCQLESIGIYFDFENSNDSPTRLDPTKSARSGHLTENVSYFLSPSLSRAPGQLSCCALLART